MKSKKNSILNDTLALTATALFVKIVGVLYKIPLTYMLGESGMGYFNTAYAVYGVFYILSSAGIPKAVALSIAERSDTADEGDLNIMCRSLVKAFSYLGFTLTLLLLILAKPLSALIANNNAFATIIAIAPSIIFVTIGGVLRGYLNGRCSFGVIAISQMLEVLSKLVIGLLMAYVGLRLSLPLPLVAALSVLGITLGTIVSCAYMYIKCFWRGNEKKSTRCKSGGKREARAIFIKSLPITAAAAITSLSAAVEPIIIMRGLLVAGLSEEAANAVYGNYSTLAIPMINLVASLFLPISIALLPKLVSAMQDNERFCNLFRSAFGVIAFAAAPAAIIYSLYSFDLLDLLFPSAHAANGAEGLSWLGISALILPLLNLTNTALESRGKAVVAFISLGLGLIVKSAISAILVSDPKFGIIGIAIGSAASYLFSLVFSLIHLASFYKKICGISRVLSILSLALMIYCPWYIWFYKMCLIQNQFAAFIISISAPTLIYIPCVALLYYYDELSVIREHYAQKKASKQHYTAKKL